MTAARTGCATCHAPVVVGDLLAGPPGNVDRHPVLLEPAPKLVDLHNPDNDGLLLHLGASADSGRWLLVPLHEPAGLRCAAAMALPHAHRQHVCDAVPGSWTDEAVLPDQREVAA